MNSAPKQEYHGRHLQPASNAVAVLAADGDRELPDAHPNESKRRTLKRIGHYLGTRFDSVELVYLSAVLEVEANDARRAEEGRAAS